MSRKLCDWGSALSTVYFRVCVKYGAIFSSIRVCQNTDRLGVLEDLSLLSTSPSGAVITKLGTGWTPQGEASESNVVMHGLPRGGDTKGVRGQCLLVCDSSPQY